MNQNPSGNTLFPIFLKLENFRVLLVGGRLVALEKLQALLANAPATAIRVVALDFHEEFLSLAQTAQHLTIEQKKYEPADMEGVDLVITAVNNLEISRQIFEDAHQRKVFINTADTPDLCDFYLGSIVQKGNLKIAISTNGKSPTMAKRLKEWLYHVLPDNLETSLDNLHRIREKMRGDFAEKIKKLNQITSNMLAD